MRQLFRLDIAPCGRARFLQRWAVGRPAVLVKLYHNSKCVGFHERFFVIHSVVALGPTITLSQLVDWCEAKHDINTLAALSRGRHRPDQESYLILPCCDSCPHSTNRRDIDLIVVIKRRADYGARIGKLRSQRIYPRQLCSTPTDNWGCSPARLTIAGGDCRGTQENEEFRPQGETANDFFWLLSL